MKKVALLFMFFFVIGLAYAGVPADVQLLESALKAIDEGRPLNPEMREAVLEYWRTAPRDGGDELDRSGGPDDFGYMFADQDEDNGPDFEWIEMTNDATDVSAELGDDNTSREHEIGFDFPFYGETYDSYWIQSNGSISFYSNYMSLSNYALPTTNYGAMICWFWDDMHRQNSEVLIETMDIDGSQAHVVTATDYGELGSGNRFDWQVAMFEGGKILMQYRDVAVDRSSCTVGIQNEGGTIGLQYCYNNANNAPDDQTAIAFFTGSTMSGVVTDATTDDPVEGANIALYNSEDDELVTETTSGEDGSYSIDQIEEGTYYAEVTKEMYVDLMVTDIEANPPEPIVQDFVIIPFMVVNLEELQNEVPIDTWVDIGGIVTLPTNSTTTEWTWFCIQDESGYGVNVYQETPWPEEDNLVRGDSVRVVGRLDEADGVTLVTDIYSWELVSQDNPVPDPLEMTTGDLAGMHDMEGSWAYTAGYIQDEPGEEDIMIRLDDESGVCWLMVYQATGIEFPWGEEDWIMVNGVIGLHEGNVTLVPSLEGDVWQTERLRPRHMVAMMTDSTEGSVDVQWNMPDAELDAYLECVLYRDTLEIYRSEDTFAFTDTIPMPEEPGTYTYEYTAVAVYHEGESDPSTPSVVEWIIEEEDEVAGNRFQGIPEEFAIASAYPNPFNSAVQVVVAVPVKSDIQVKVFDVLGRNIANLEQGQLEAGYHKFNWRADGAAGIYFLQVSSESGWSAMKKLVYVK